MGDGDGYTTRVQCPKVYPLGQSAYPTTVLAKSEETSSFYGVVSLTKSEQAPSFDRLGNESRIPLRVLKDTPADNRRESFRAYPLGQDGVPMTAKDILSLIIISALSLNRDVDEVIAVSVLKRRSIDDHRLLISHLRKAKNG